MGLMEIQQAAGYSLGQFGESFTKLNIAGWQMCVASLVMFIRSMGSLSLLGGSLRIIMNDHELLSSKRLQFAMENYGPFFSWIYP